MLPVLITLLLPLASASTATDDGSAQVVELPPDPEFMGKPAPVVLGKASLFELLPGTNYYPTYTASPRELCFGVAIMSVAKNDVPDAGDIRMALKLGGHFGLFRVASREHPGRGWQVNLDAGYYGQFDPDNALDSIGWDGFYGLNVVRSFNPSLALRVGALHQSAHVGDEYAERTGRTRIGYTREELRAGVSYRFTPRLRSYCEAGWAYHLNSNLQAPWRAQAGAVYEVPDAFWDGRFGWYAATDLASTQESDWRLDLSLQIGLVAPSQGRHWRVGLEFYDGRQPLGEFFQATERYLAFGIWLDL